MGMYTNPLVGSRSRKSLDPLFSLGKRSFFAVRHWCYTTPFQINRQEGETRAEGRIV